MRLLGSIESADPLMISRSQNLIWAAGFSLIFPIVYVPLWMMEKSTEFELHVSLWNVLFAGGVFAYGIRRPADQNLGVSLLWIFGFAVISFVAGLLFDFIRCPSDMTVYLGDTIWVSLYYFVVPSLFRGIAAYFAATALRRTIAKP